MESVRSISCSEVDINIGVDHPAAVRPLLDDGLLEMSGLSDDGQLHSDTDITPRLTISTVNIGCPDPGALARFYERLLGWQITDEEPDWVMLRSPDVALALSFQTEETYVLPVWPAAPGEQQMMLHLEIRVDDLAAATSHAVDCSATGAAPRTPQRTARGRQDNAGAAVRR